jgi:hypothetical protein
MSKTKNRLDELEKRVKHLEGEVVLSVPTGEVEFDWCGMRWTVHKKFEMWRVIRRILEHLDLEIQYEPARGESFTIVEKEKEKDG